MANYDRSARESRPSLYLASPSLANQLAITDVVISSNNLQLTGMPLIYGHKTSFKLEPTKTATFDGNPFFEVGSVVEFVLYAPSPLGETEVLAADNGTAVTITNDHLVFRLVSNLDGQESTAAAYLPITDWSSKKYVRAVVGESEISLTVNNRQVSESYEGTPGGASESYLGGTFAPNHFFLVDGLGIYRQAFHNKGRWINDPDPSHSAFVAAHWRGETTDLENRSRFESIDITLDDCEFDPEEQVFIYAHMATSTDDTSSFVLVRVNRPNIPIRYDVNFGGIEEFVSHVLVEVDDPELGSLITLEIPGYVDDDFVLSIDSFRSLDITGDTPAVLVADGLPVFPRAVEDSIVNVPAGVLMDGASFNGTWVETEDLNQVPPSLELAFKPNDLSVDFSVFSSTDGAATRDSVTGYTAWLNGALVTDLSAAGENQWNHLVLVMTSPSAETFTINSTKSDMDLLFLSLFHEELVDSDVQTLLAVLTGQEILTVSNEPLTVTEGSFSNGQPFQLYSPPWAIVGAGGA